MDPSTFTVTVENPQAVVTGPNASTAIIYAGASNTLVITFTAGEDAALTTDAPLVLDFSRFAASETPVAKAQLDGVALVTANGKSTISAKGTADSSGRRFSVAVAATLDAGDAVAITVCGVTVSAPDGGGRNPNFKGSWSDADGTYAYAVEISVQPAPSSHKVLALSASWGLQQGIVAVTAPDGLPFDNTIDLYLTNNGTQPIVLTDATFRIAAPTVKNNGDPARFNALCTEAEIEAATAAPITDMQSAWDVANDGKVDSDLAWLLTPKSDVVEPQLAPGASIGLRISGLVTRLPARDDFKVLFSIACAVPGYTIAILPLAATKVTALLAAVCDTDANGFTFCGAPLTLNWQVPIDVSSVTLTQKIVGQPDNTLGIGLPASGNMPVEIMQTSAFVLSTDGSQTWQVTVRVGTVALSFVADRTSTPLPGAPVVFSYTMEMARDWRLTTGVASGAGGLRVPAQGAARTTTVYPLTNTTYGLEADGYDASQHPPLVTVKASIAVAVPAPSAAVHVMFGAVDGLWLYDLSTFKLTRLDPAQGGAPISDLIGSGLGAITAFWGYVDLPNVEVRLWSSDLSVLDSETGQPGGVPPNEAIMSIASGFGVGNSTRLVLAGGIIYDQDGTVLQSAPGANRIRYTPNGNQVYIAGPAGLVHGPARASPTSIVTWSGAAKAAAMELYTGPQNGALPVLLWIDPDRGGLYWAQPQDPPSPFSPSGYINVCGASLAAGCWSLFADSQLNFIYWFEDDPSGCAALCRYDVQRQSRSVLFLVDPAHRPVGGGLVAW